MKDLALLVLRATTGTLLAGHGAQKLFGWFGGSGLEGTRAWLKSMGLRPGRTWAIAAGASEFGGGLLTCLGFLNPLGSLGIMGAMSMATVKVHWGKPIWVTSGGAELPITNIAIATALALVGPGKYSLDHLLGIHLPRWLVLPGVAAIALSVMTAVKQSENQVQVPEEIAGAELQAGKEAAHEI